MVAPGLRGSGALTSPKAEKDITQGRLMNRTTLVILAVLALAFAGLTGLAVRKGILDAPQSGPGIGGPFQLVDQRGRPASQDILKGKWSTVFFGFTYCPEACPTTLFALGQTEKLLNDKNFQTVFISVDPGRDTPKQLNLYLSNPAFPHASTGLTGAPDKIAAVAKEYGAFYMKSGDGPDYTVNHSTQTYLMNPKGRFVCVIPYGVTPQVFAAKIQAAMKQGSNAQSC
jgi:protein SCO1/2